MQEWAEQSGDEEVDLEHPDTAPVDTPGARPAADVPMAAPAMLSAPVRAPPPTKPAAAPPSTGNQDEGGVNPGQAERAARRAGRGGPQQPRGQPQGRGGRTLVDTQRQNDVRCWHCMLFFHTREEFAHFLQYPSSQAAPSTQLY